MSSNNYCLLPGKSLAWHFFCPSGLEVKIRKEEKQIQQSFCTLNALQYLVGFPPLLHVDAAECVNCELACKVLVNANYINWL